MAVNVSGGPPTSARLLAWGQHRHAWWGLLAWQQVITADGVDAELPFAAWVPAERIQQRPMAGVVELPRLRLPDDQRDWPPPAAGWPVWFVGPWTDGALPVPAGLELVTGALWRRRSRRA